MRGGAENGRRTVFIAVCTGFEARLLLRTGIFKRLRASGRRLVVLCPNADEDYIRSEFDLPGVSVEQLDVRPPKRSRPAAALEYMLKTVRQFTLNWSGSPATWLRNRVDRFAMHLDKAGRLEKGVVIPLVWLARRVKWFRKALYRLENLLFAPDLHGELFRRYCPDLVVTATPGYNDWDARLLREARRAGARTATVMLGWDNPNTRGYPGCKPDLLVVWSPIMEQEMIRLADFAPDRVRQGGIAHFELNTRPENLLSREELAVRFDLDPNRPIILLGTRTPSAYANTYIIELLARAMETDPDLADCQLLVRLHPIYMRRKYKADEIMTRDFEAMMALRDRHPGLRFSVPEVLSQKLLFDLSGDDQLVLASIIRHCRVAVNLLSTLNLEIVLQDKPLINVLFDPPEEHRPEKYLPLGVAARWSHNQRVLSSGATRVAMSEAELIDQLKMYLADPAIDADNRAALRQAECIAYPGVGEEIGGHVLSALSR